MHMARIGAEGVKALVSPRNVVIVGASDKPGSWSKRVFTSLTRTGFDGAIYPVNPRSETVWGGKTCYKNLAELPDTPDHVVILVPGAAVIDVIKEAGEAGARSATIFSSGFGEGDDGEGLQLASALRAAVAESGLAVSGPNCLGNLAAPYKLMTLTDTRIDTLQRGPVAIFGQSGGIVTATYRALLGRGIQPGYALTVGNEIGLNSADYIRYFSEDEDTRVIVGYVEAIKDPVAFREACLVARQAGKPVVLLKIGGSEESRAAALAHTGSLAGSLDCFDAVAAATGVIRVDTIDDIVEVVELLTHGALPTGPRVGAITFSGGFKGLLLEAAARNDISFPKLNAETLSRLSEIVGIGTSLGNPFDAGFTALSSGEAYLKCVDILKDDPNLDLLIVQEELPSREGLNAKADNLSLVDDIASAAGGKPIAVVSMASYMYTDYTRDYRRRFPNLPVLHEIDSALKAIGAVSRWNIARERDGRASREVKALPAADMSSILSAGSVTEGQRILGEAASKALIEAYGIRAPREVFAASAAAAAAAADKIGYPIVLKLVSPDVQHKTEVGGVVVDIQDKVGVENAFGQIRGNLSACKPDARFEGVLVAEQVGRGAELVFGVQSDPEVGPVVMFGTGGILLELYKDVAFGAVPLSRAGAEEMIAKTKAGQLIDGFRGSAPCDHDAVVDALVGLSRLAADLGDRLESIDLNPVVARPGQKGIVALDALVVLKEETK